MINILKGAQHELDDAFEYYESQMAGLGNEFIEEFEKAAQSVASILPKHPQMSIQQIPIWNTLLC